jgi:hypothetical protein
VTRRGKHHQTWPTPIVLRYAEGTGMPYTGISYGEKVFPLQVVINLNEPGGDHTGALERVCYCRWRRERGR